MESFNENLRGANVGDHKNFDVQYPRIIRMRSWPPRNFTMKWMYRDQNEEIAGIE
jgi:hypothetical protein